MEKKITIGETRMMNCGMNATIIAYRNNTDIDVRFEDGTIITHRELRQFKKGQIDNKKINRYENKYLGETRMMKCGMNATIIAYRNNEDIDVQFEDGTIVTNRKCKEFKNSGINNPNFNKFVKKHIGETRMMNCGMNATIIAYRNRNDIDVQFEDGTIITHREMKSFKKGEIKNKNINKFAEKRIGETRMMNYGMNATIIAYRNLYDIDIKFENGTIVKNVKYTSFKKNSILYPLLQKNNYFIKYMNLKGNLVYQSDKLGKLYNVYKGNEMLGVMNVLEIIEYANSIE